MMAFSSSSFSTSAFSPSAFAFDSILVPQQVSEAGAGYYPYPVQIDDIEEETLFIFTATRN